MQINVLEYFEKGCLIRCRERVAVREQNRQFTFAELERFAKNCATLVLKKTPTKNQPIPVFLPKSAENIVADLGILYSGNAYANLDIKSPPQRLKGMLQNLAPQVILTSAAQVPALRALEIPEDKLVLIEQAIVPEALYDNAALLQRLESLLDTDPYCFIHTSGSTGIPKGVALNHRSTIDFADWAFERLGLDGSEVMGSLAPIYFDAYTLEFCMCIAKGSTWVVVPEQLAMFPAKLVEFIVAQPINFIFWVPTVMVNIANMDLLATFKLDRLKKVFFIGEVFPTKHLNYWRRHLPGAMFVNLYGPIEITVACTYYIADRELGDDEKLPVGFPCRNTEILIFNDQNQLAKVDEPGEICVRGSSLALGYYNNAERTARGFAQNPLNSHYSELIYRTGDVGYWNSRGEIMFLGRKDFQIKHLGYRIELGEIEHAVLQVDGIRNCCVVYNQNKKEITLFYECDQELAPGLFRERLSPYLPKYMLPTVFNRMELMPRNPNGKIDRQRLVSSVN
ncbi:MAG TPA: amino acid adenylation domain-containing protein [Candidatus Binatia bacterium]|jgi:D-alanine--poly(phosphoribitol) ligase subunit 1|nr:amino acid adenylation domain-containing protein [Candidatus Binatia bacterium]